MAVERVARRGEAAVASVRGGTTQADDPLVVSAFTRGLDVFRPVALAYTAVLAWIHRDEMSRPAVAVAVLAVLAVWSLGLLVRKRRTVSVVVTEVALACLGILATRLAYPTEAIIAGAPTLPGVWAASGVVAAAVLGGMRGGAVAAVVVSLVDLVEVQRPNATTLHNIVLLLLLGILIGLAVDLARESQRRLEAALVAQERLAERERLSRVVHDGVLQALSLIHRRGTDIGGDAAGLAGIAAQEEAALRRFVSRDVAAPGTPTAGDAPSDLGALLGHTSGPGVTVSAPADPVLVEGSRAREVHAAVLAALDNVEQHGGEGARAWVLLEDVGDRVLVTVRDDGLGMPDGRLPDAESDGRLGFAQCIAGRIRDLGGTLTVISAPGAGCTISMDVPVRAAHIPTVPESRHPSPSRSAP